MHRRSLAKISMMFDTAELLLVEHVEYQIHVSGERVVVELSLTLDEHSAKRMASSKLKGAASMALSPTGASLNLRGLPNRFAPLLERLRRNEGFESLLDEGVPFPLLLDLRHFEVV